MDASKAFVLRGRVIELSNEVPSFFHEQDNPHTVAEPWNAGTPEQDTVVLLTPSKVAEPSDAGFFKEEDFAIPVGASQKVTRHMPVGGTKPLVVGDWLTDKDITACLNKLHHNEIIPWAWTIAVT